MEKDRLLKLLEELHAELSAAGTLDPETRDRVQALADDIDRLTDDTKDNQELDKEPLTSGLHDLVLKFEGDHPQLSAAIGRVADALAAMGI
jgi:hypothetical protein